jgi:hypothetical protein
LFFGENRAIDGKARAGARRVDLQRDGARDDRLVAKVISSASPSIESQIAVYQ